MKLSFRNLQSCRGTDGLAWSGTLCDDGRRIADVCDGGHGGGLEIHWFDQRDGKSADRERVAAVVAALPMEPPSDLFPEGRKRDMDEYLAELADDAAEVKRFERACKTKTVFRDGKGKVWNYRRPYTPEAKAEVIAKYGDVEFINDRFGGFVNDGAAIARREEQKRIMRACRNKTLFRVGDKWMQVNAPFTAEVKARVVAKYGPVQFANEGMGFGV